jgi:hypothetical protein
VMVHELTHAYQYNDGPGWLIEGMADLVRFRAGHVPVSNRRPGGSYDDAYQTTAFFLAWIDDAHAGFGRALNASLASDDDEEWTEEIFRTLTGESVGELWDAYQDAL